MHLSTTLSGNAAALIAEAILSVRDWVDGTLLIDTGITDTTIEISRELASEKLKVVKFP